MDYVWGVIALLTCVGAVGLLVYLQIHGPDDRHAEDAARDFFDEHGHWPDETP